MSLHDDLKAYLDGELPPERMAEMREALDRDPQLAQEAAILRGLSQSLRTMAHQPAAAGLEDTLKALSRRERRPWWPWLAPLVVGAAALMFVVLPVRHLQQGAQSDMARDTVAMSATSKSAIERFREIDTAKIDGVPEDRKQQSTAKSGTTFGAAAKPSADVTPLATKAMQKPDPKTVKARERLKQSAPSPAAPTNPRRPVTDASSPKLEKREATGPRPAGAAGSAEPVGAKPAPENSRLAILAPKEEPLVIEVESTEEAESAIRELALRMGAQVTPPAVISARYSSGSVSESNSVSKLRDAPTVERKIVLEVEDDQVDETRKRVTEAVREAQARREAQQLGNRNGLSGGFGGGGFGGTGGLGGAQGGPGGRGGSQQGDFDRSGQRQGPGHGPSRGGDLKNEAGNQAAAQAQNDQSIQRRLRGNAQTKGSAKPRRKLEIILKIKPAKPAGKVEE